MKGLAVVDGWLARFVLWQKLALLGALAVLSAAIPVYLYVAGIREGTISDRRESAGIDPCRQLMNVMRLMQQHRGLSAQILNGAGNRAAREAKQQEVAAELEAVAGKYGSEGDAPIAKNWKLIAGRWTTLAQKVASSSISAQESFDEHSAIIGYSLMSMAVDEAHVLNLCVEPPSRGLGLGRRLLQHMITLARASNATIVLLEVRKSNKLAIQLYESEGFKRLGLRKGYYPAHGGREDALVLGYDIV